MILAKNGRMPEVYAYLCANFPGNRWKLSVPRMGSGHESYFATTKQLAFFVKLGVQPEKYQAMFELGLSPTLVHLGHLADGTNLVMQEMVKGKRPSQKDFHRDLDQFAQAIGKTHRCEKLRAILPPKIISSFKDAGLETLAQTEKRWALYKFLVKPASIAFVDDCIGYLREQVMQFQGAGLVASHNDLCNANWLVSSGGKVYLIDYESMSLDDPALDLGAILWWYYPPDLRPEFLKIAGYGNDVGFQNRMRIRMAIHCLNIILPRENSFDHFEAGSFDESLGDFRAVLEGRENPQGYMG